jgi:hypothetical protein
MIYDLKISTVTTVTAECLATLLSLWAVQG